MIPLGSKLIPLLGHKLEHRNKEDQLKNSSLKLEGIEHLLVDLCQFYSHDAPWNQNCPRPRGHKLGTKGIKMWNSFVGKMTWVSDPGPSWPSCWHVASSTGPLPKKLQIMALE